MTTFRDYRDALTEAPVLTSFPVAHPRLDRTALAAGAADRRQRMLDIDAEIDAACEMAAIGPNTLAALTDRTQWHGPTWHRYVDEAVHQARARAGELRGLRREAELLERLLDAQ